MGCGTGVAGKHPILVTSWRTLFWVMGFVTYIFGSITPTVASRAATCTIYSSSLTAGLCGGGGGRTEPK